jgi:hypothetical protein
MFIRSLYRMVLSFLLIIFVGTSVYIRIHGSSVVPEQIRSGLQDLADNRILGAQITPRTKTAHCQINGSYPDPACTPGDILADVQLNDLCQATKAESEDNISDDVKAEVLAEYDLNDVLPSQYPIDHLVSVGLGGSNDIANLWPQPIDPRPGFLEKNQVESFLHQQVCLGNLSLAEAQKRLVTDWLRI